MDNNETTIEPIEEQEAPVEVTQQDVAVEEAISSIAKKATEEVNEIKERLLRTAAEYDNYRKRSSKERDAAFGNGVSFAAENFLPILDALEMAAAATCADEEYKKGIEMTVAKCKQAFASAGIEEIVAQGEMFNPDLHCAVGQKECEQPSGTVLEVYQKGYKLKDKILRHSGVVVAF